MIGDIKKFRFWCQKVIPLVYDNSLSYYEVLCKVVDYLNKVIEDINEIPSYIDAKIEEALDDEHVKEILEQFVAELEAAISANNEHDNDNSSADYNVGQLLWWKGSLYKVIRTIDAGDTFIVDTNIELVNFEELFDDFIHTIKASIAEHDDGSNTTASHDWHTGDWLWLNDTLYEVLSDINEGNAYVFTGDNANVSAITVEDIVGDRTELNTEYKDNLVEAINEVNAHADTNTEHIGNLELLDTENKLNLVRAVNEVNAHTDTNTDHIGNLTLLNTDDKGNLVGAINEVDAHVDTNTNNIGNLTLLKTNDKGNLVGAINESMYEYYQGKKILIVGDSISNPTEATAGTQPVWSTQFKNKLSGIADVDIVAQSGIDMINLGNLITSRVTEWDYDIAIVFAGVNDFSHNVPLGNYGTDYTTKFSDAVRNVYQILHNNMNACRIIFITPLYHTAGLNTLGYPSWFYNAAITGFCKRWGIQWINGYNFPLTGELGISVATVDGLHPKSSYATIMCDYIMKKIEAGCDVESYNNGSLVLDLSNKLESGVTGTLRAYLLDEKLHIHGRVTLTPAGNNVALTSALDFITEANAQNPYGVGSSYNNTDGGITGLIHNSSNCIYANFHWTNGTSNTIEFDYVVSPEWCNIIRAY